MMISQTHVYGALVITIMAFCECVSVSAEPSGEIPMPTVTVDIELVRARLLAEEDTDTDNRITIDDLQADSDKGDCRFSVTSIDNTVYEVVGTYYLSNLLQELTLFAENGAVTASLSYEHIFENPVNRISRSIRERFWDGLTRRLDGGHIGAILTDSKTDTDDGYRYLYVPASDAAAYEYYTDIAAADHSLNLMVVQLPDVVTPEWVRNVGSRHGLLSLALENDENGSLRGVPFVVPGGRFNEMYGWDSYFESLGLIADGRVDLAKGMVDNFVYEIEQYGKILNANRTYYLTRSQPPFLTAIALTVFEQLPDSQERVVWLENVFRSAIKEYREVWMASPRLTDTGLSRYYGEGMGQPPEVEPGHFDAVYAQFADIYGMSADELEFAYTAGTIDVPELDTYFVHDRSMRESGHDTTWRWDDRCADFVTVDLNALLYRYEKDIATTIREVFGDSLRLSDGTIETSETWFTQMEKRKSLMNSYLWDSDHGLFLDYDLAHRERKLYMSPTMLYPLWAGFASDEQAASIVEAVIPALEMPGGLAASDSLSRGTITDTYPQRQWDYPYGWAPHQMIAWQGLIDYGFSDIAERLVYRWLYTITRNAVDYNGTVPEKYDVVARSHRVFAEYGNVGTDFSYITREGFGWMNASYQVGLALLPETLCEQLNQLVPPEWLFGR